VLAEARRQAGLSVADVSQQTRIRESIIRGIEQDDYSGCGGDFYARGHIRAMARAVGTDPAPLIEEYDAVQVPPGGIGADSGGPYPGPDEPAPGIGMPGETGPAYRPGDVPPPPAELGLPYQPGGFRPLPATPGPPYDSPAGHRAPGQPIPALDTGNVRPIPADTGPPHDNGTGPPSFTGPDTAAEPSPATSGPGPAQPSAPAGAAPTVYTFTDPSAAAEPDPGPPSAGYIQPSPPAGAAPTVYSFSDPGAVLDDAPGSFLPDPDATSDFVPGGGYYGEPDEEPGDGAGRRVFSDFDTDSDSVPGGRFFSEPGAEPDDDAGGRFFTEPAAPYDPDAQYDANTQYDTDVPYGTDGQYDTDAPYETGTSYDADVPYGTDTSYDVGVPYDANVAYDTGTPYDTGASYETGVPYDAGAPYGTDGTRRGRPGWREPGASQPEPTGLDALFHRTDAEPPREEAATESRGYPGGPATGAWAARPAPGIPPGTSPPGTPPPTSYRPVSPPPTSPRRRQARAGARGPAGPAAWRTARERRPDRMVIILVGLLVVIGVVSYLLLSGSGPAPRSRPAAGATSHPSASHSPSATPTSSNPSPPPSPQVQTLQPASAAAFGPAGGHGDNPQDARLAIDGLLRTAWQSEWYNTSHFGNLQNGTGLLLNMGGQVTISRVMLNLGSTHGAGLQVRAGSSPHSLRTVATANGTSGLVRLQLSKPAQARYLLIWFTTLPQDPAGTYQAKLYNVRVRGSH
jgi:hypothetical protein